MLAFDDVESADAAADVYPDALGDRVVDLEACGLSREVGRRDREEDEPSHLPQVLLVDVVERIEVLDLARHLAGEIFGVEVSDASDAVEAFTKGLPGSLRPNSNWRNQPYCGYDNPSQTDSSLPAA